MDNHASALEAVEALHQKYLVEEIDHVEKPKEDAAAAPAEDVSAEDPASPASPEDAAAAPAEDPPAAAVAPAVDDDAAAAAPASPEEAAAAATTSTTEESNEEKANNNVDITSGDFKQKIFLYVQRAQRREDREKEKRDKEDVRRQERAKKFQGMNIYIKNLGENVSDEMLRTEFDQYGTITSAKVMYSKEGKSRGFGFVCFSSQDEANKAIAEMQGKMIDDLKITVSIGKRRMLRDFYFFFFIFFLCVATLFFFFFFYDSQLLFLSFSYVSSSSSSSSFSATQKNSW